MIPTETETVKRVEQNPFYEQLTRILSDRSFSEYRQQHFRNWSDMETLCLFIFLHDVIQNQWMQRGHPVLETSHVIRMMDFIMNDSNLRRITVDFFREYQQGQFGSQRRFLKKKHRRHRRLIHPTEDEEVKKSHFPQLPSFLFRLEC